MNNVSIAGRLTRDPELRKTQTGKSVANFSIAISMGKDKTEFVNCIAWEKTGELITEYCKKGDMIPCVGELQTRTWEKDGEKRYATEVVVHKFDFPARPKEEKQSEPQTGGYGGSDLEDEIPFMRHLDFIGG